MQHLNWEHMDSCLTPSLAIRQKKRTQVEMISLMSLPVNNNWEMSRYFFMSLETPRHHTFITRSSDMRHTCITIQRIQQGIQQGKWNGDNKMGNLHFTYYTKKTPSVSHSIMGF